MAETDDLPPVVDVREMLDRIERDTDDDEEVPAYLAEIRDPSARYPRRDRSGRASLVDDVDGSVIAMREYLDGDADRWAEGIENRVRVSRDSLREASGRLHLAGVRLAVDAGERRDLDVRAYVPEEAASFDVTALDAADPETATL